MYNQDNEEMFVRFLDIHVSEKKIVSNYLGLGLNSHVLVNMKFFVVCMCVCRIHMYLHMYHIFQE